MDSVNIVNIGLIVTGLLVSIWGIQEVYKGGDDVLVGKLHYFLSN
jgi:hypothetical protein